MATFADLIADSSTVAGKMRQFRREIRGCVNRPLLYHAADGYGAVLFHLFERMGRGERVHDGDVHELMAVGGPTRVGPTLIPGAGGKSIAWVGVRGVALYDLDYPPYCFSTLRLGQQIKELAADFSIKSIILDINSPGGAVTGTELAADAVYAANKRKPVVAYVDPLCASAAYWIGSQAGTIVAATRAADIGSIGVLHGAHRLFEVQREPGIEDQLHPRRRAQSRGQLQRAAL